MAATLSMEKLVNWKLIAGVLVAAAATGCAMASPVMDAGDGNYLISARAAPARGGATGAQTVAYGDAQKFCAQKGDGSHPVVVNTQERDIYQSSFGGGFNQYGGGFSGGTMAAGAVNFRFRCAQ
jgi:hypothetical protein